MLTARVMTALALAVSSLLFSGCSVVDAVHGSDRPQSMVGKTLNDLDPSVGMFFHDGQLIIANDGQIEGIAVVDTGTEIVTGFHAIGKTIWSMVHDPVHNAGYVMFAYGSGGQGSYRLNASTQNLTRITPWNPEYWDSFMISGGEIFVRSSIESSMPESSTQRLTWIEADGDRMVVKATVSTKEFRAIAVAGGKLFTRESYDTKLAIYPLRSPLQKDSLTLDLDSAFAQFGLPAPHPSNLSFDAWGDHLVLTVRAGDSGRVVLLDANSLAVTKAVPLRFDPYMSGRRILNDTLYVISSGRYGWSMNPNDWPTLLVGGVEAIDLKTGAHLGTLTTEAELNRFLMDFVPTGGLGGYAAIGRAHIPPDNGYYRKIPRPSPGN